MRKRAGALLGLSLLWWLAGGVALVGGGIAALVAATPERTAERARVDVDPAATTEPGPEPGGVGPDAPPRRELTVRIVRASDGAPLTGHVELVEGWAGARRGSAATDADGVARLAVARDASAVRGRAHGFRMRQELIPKAADEITLRLLQGVVVDGRVVMAGSGAGVADARVEVFEPDVGVIPRGAARELDADLRTDEAGRFSTGVRAGVPFRLLVRAPGFEPVEVDEMRAGPGEVLDVVIGESCTVAGLVVDDRRRPVAGALVVVRAPQFAMATIDPLEDEYHDAGVMPAACETDAAGRFEWHGLFPGDHVAVVRVPGKHSGVRRKFVVSPPRTELELLVKTWPTLTVHVVGEDGGPIERRRVSVFGTDGGAERLTQRSGPVRRVPEYHDRIGTLSSREPPMTIALRRPGSYEVRVESPFHSLMSRTVEVKEGHTETTFRLASGLELTGRVVGTDGKARSNVPVIFEAGDVGRGGVTDDEGRFRLHGVPAASGKLLVRGSRRYVRKELPVDPTGGPVEVVVEEAALMRGVVKPVPRDHTVTVIYRHKEGGSSTWEQAIDPDGSFEILVPRNGEVVFFRQPGLEPLRVPAVADVAIGAVHDLGVLRMRPGVALEGVVRNDAGVPVQGALVTVWQNEFEHEGYADGFGRFRIETLQAGQAAFARAHRAGYLDDEKEVRPGEASSFVLRPGGTIRFRLTGPDGEGLLGHFQVRAVPLTDEGTEAAPGTVGELFADERLAVPPGRYRIYVQASTTGREAKQPAVRGPDVTVAAGNTAVAAVQLSE